MAFVYLLGTADDRFTPSRDITKFVEHVETSNQLSKESEIRVTLSNPNGIFTDASRNDYIPAQEDYVFLVQYNGLNYFRGVITDSGANDENARVVNLTVRSDAEYLKRCLFSRAYSPEDWVYVEDIIEDMFKIASPRPSYYGMEYRVQHGYEDNFDALPAGVVPPNWTEDDANGALVVAVRPYNGTAPMYISEPNSVHLSCNANTQHVVHLDKLYNKGNKVIISLKVYIDTAIGNYQYQVILRDENDIQLCYAQMTKIGANTNIYISDGAGGRLILGPIVPASGFFTFRFVVDLDTDTYGFYFGQTGLVRYGADAGHANCAAWAAGFNNNMNLTNTGKVSVDRIVMALDDQASGAQRDVYIDDVYALEGDPLPRTPLSREHRFSVSSIHSAVTQLCAQYGLEWRDETDPRRLDTAYLRTLRVDPTADAVLSVSTTTNITHGSAQRSATSYKNFFVVRGKDDVIGYAADVDSIAERGFFPLEKNDSAAESGPDVEEYAEALKNEHCRTPLTATLAINGEKLGYDVALALRAGNNVSVTYPKTGLGSTQKYTIGKVTCSIEGKLAVSLDISDIWKSAAVLAYQALREAKAATSDDPIDIVHLRYLAARVAVSGDWAFVGCTAAPAVSSVSGITAFGKRAIREMQVSDILSNNDYPYTERPTRYRLVDDQGAGFADGPLTIDRWAISAVGVDGDGDKYCEIEFSMSAAYVAASYFTWARTELVSKRTMLVTESLGTSDMVLELDNTEDLRVHDKLTITNAGGGTVTVNVMEVMGNKVQIYGAHAVVMPRGSICVAYCNVLAAEDHTPVHQAAANNISVQMTFRFTNEETPTTQGQILTDGLIKFCQRLRAPGDVKAMNNNSGAAIVFTADTVNLNVGDYVNLLDTATGDNELRVIQSINAGVSVTLTENLTYAYNAGDEIRLVCFPWQYIAYGVDETSHASNYYTAKKRLDKEVGRVSGVPFAPSTADRLKFSVAIGAGAFPAAMANTYLDGNHVATTQLKLLSSKGMATGQTVYIGTTLPLAVRTISSVDSATQITVSAVVTANDGDVVATGLRRDMNETETMYEVALADCNIDTGETDVKYYLGAYLTSGERMAYGHGGFQYDEYTNKDSQNNEYVRSGLGTSGAPATFHSDAIADAEYITGVTGIGASIRPITAVWRVRVEQNPLVYRKGRYPSLDQLVAASIPLDPSAVTAMDGDVVASEVIRPAEVDENYRRIKDLKKPIFGRFRVNRERREAIQRFRDEYVATGIHHGLLFEVDLRGITNREYLHPDSLIISLFGNGQSWNGTDWTSGLYVFVWLKGNGTMAQGIPYDDQDKNAVPHWEFVPLVDVAGADVDSTTLVPALQMGTLYGGNIAPTGNRINQAMLNNSKAYILVIPRNADDLDHPSYVNVDYMTVGIDTTPLARDSAVRNFRAGIDYLWAREWNFITWPGSTPTNQITTLSAHLYTGGCMVRVTNDNQLSVGDIIYIGTDPYLVLNLLADNILTIDPPARSYYASGTSVQKTHYDRGLDLWVDSKYYHSMTPAPANAIYTASGAGGMVEVKNIAVATLTLRSTDLFQAGDDVILFGAHTMEHKWTTIASITDGKTLVVTSAPAFVPTHIGLTSVAFEVADSQFATPQQIISSYSAIRTQCGIQTSWTPPTFGHDINQDYSRAGLPGVVVDWIDETNGKIYVSAAMPHVEFKNRVAALVVNAASADGLSITTNVVNLNPNEWKRGYVKVTHAGIPQIRAVRANDSGVIYVWMPFDPIPAGGDAIELSVEMGQSFINGYDRFWCDNGVDWLVFYDTRIEVDAPGAANPTITDESGDETIATTADKIRPVRGSRFFVDNVGGTNDLIIKCGAVVTEASNAINNDNLCLEELILPLAEFGFRLHAKYGASWITNATTGLVRQCIDVVDKESWANTTTLSAAAYIGQTMIQTVANVFVVDDVILIHTVGGEELAQVQSIIGAGPFQITLYSPLRKPHINGTNVRKAYYKKVILETVNPYGPLTDPTVRVTVPFKYGAVYRVQYAVGRGKLLARALLDPDDLATPVTMKRSETMKAAMEVAFNYD